MESEANQGPENRGDPKLKQLRQQKNNMAIERLDHLPASSKWPFRGLSDLCLGNQKVTLKKLVGDKCPIEARDFPAKTC